MPWDSAGSFISLCQWIYIFFPTVPHGYSFSVEDEWLEYSVWAHHEAVAQQQGRGEAPCAHLEPHSCPRVSLCPNHFSLICPWPGTHLLKVAELPLQKSCQNFGELGNSVCSLRLVGLPEGLVLFGCPCVGSCSVPVEIRITIDFKNKKIQDTFISFLMLLCH